LPDSSHYFIISVKPQNMKAHFFAVGLLADVSATELSGQGIDKVGGIMMRSLQEGMPCYAEGEAIGICLVLENYDMEEIEACTYCPLNAVVASGMEGCSSSEVESFCALVQSCGVNECHGNCLDELQAGVECMLKYASCSDTCLAEFDGSRRGGGGGGGGGRGGGGGGFGGGIGPISAGFKAGVVTSSALVAGVMLWMDLFV
jgi:hypothetical protein